MKYLYGPNGSRWKQVRHIPHELDSQGIVYFRQGDGYYRNSKGTTYQMVERGGDNWNGRLRASYNVYLQRKRVKELGDKE